MSFILITSRKLFEVNGRFKGLKFFEAIHVVHNEKLVIDRWATHVPSMFCCHGIFTFSE